MATERPTEIEGGCWGSYVEYLKNLEAERDTYNRTLDHIFEEAGVTELADLELVILAGRLHRERCD